MKIDTIEKARALPLIENELYEEIREEMPDGTIRISNRVRKLYGRGIEGDEIILFIDSDGTPMKVIATESGPAKTPFCLFI